MYVIPRKAHTFYFSHRYIIRLEATDGRGGLLTHDFPIIMRKDNDTARAAPCCR